MTTEQLSLAGVKNVTLNQIKQIITELGLEDIAESVGEKFLPQTATEEIQAIRTNAPLRAIDQCVRNFIPNGKPSALSNYLKPHTWFWAKRYAENVLKGKPVPKVSLNLGGPDEGNTTPVIPIQEAADTDGITGLACLLHHLGITSYSTEYGHSFRLLCGGVEMLFFANTLPEAIVFFGYLPVFIPVYRRAAVAEALSRINWRILCGTFEMDLQDGQVRIRCLVPAAGGILDPGIAGKSLSTIRQEASTFSRVIVELALTDHDPETLVERAAADDE